MVVIKMTKSIRKTKPRFGSRRPRPARAGAVARVSGPMKRAIQQVARKQMETKYVGETTLANALITAGASTPAGLIRMLPRVASGVGDNQRLGDKIEPTRATTRWTIHFQNGVSNAFEDLQINLLVLSVKGAKTLQSVANVPGQSLLRNGSGGNTDPSVGTFTQNQFIEEVNHYPVNTDQYTVLKHFRKRFAKGSYDVTGPPGANATSQIAVEKPCVTFSYSWRPPTLLYNQIADTLPSNHYPVYIVWCSVSDGGPYSGNLYHACRTDMFYKDA